MRSTVRMNDGWVFHEGFEPEWSSELRPGGRVRLPHTAVELPFGYFDEGSYQRRFCYQKVIAWTPEFAEREVSLLFDGAMANSTVFLNGRKVSSHRDGYTPFEARLTGGLKKGENVVTVRIDGTENPDIPPFGGQIDYLTYAGIYRDVWLRVAPPVSIERLKVETPDALGASGTAMVRVDIRDAHRAGGDIRLAATLLDPGGDAIGRTEAVTCDSSAVLQFAGPGKVALWDLDSPELYRVIVDLACPAGTDRVQTNFGYRTAEFTPDGFLLNGKPVGIRGLNRHQSFPHVGYAAGRRVQERDAEILKRKLGCNLVRTSHYPQSPWFLDHCDRVGLLVFEEIPGWQHIGGAAWKRDSVQNVRRMIQRDWNHPSIVLWGVRINESADDHDFYAETNALARMLDPTRQTAGVRNFPCSEFLEDVYTMNDFVLGSETLPGANHGRIALRRQAEVTGLNRTVPYLVTEFNGHMYPTKSTDPEERQIEHVTRHLQVLDAAGGDPQVSGCIGWCMADYNTHCDFGSGDRICHHGVLDMHRDPKFAAYAYASQRDPAAGVVLTPVTFWARGERSIGGAIPLMILTNCEEVEYRIGNGITGRAYPDRAAFPNLEHPPVIIDDRHIPRREQDRWGMEWFGLELTGFVGGDPVRTMRLAADPVPVRLGVSTDFPELLASEKDHVPVRVRVLDQAGNPLPHFNEPLTVRVVGPARLVGPDLLAFRGGRAAFWLESVGERGCVEIEVAVRRLAPARLKLDAV